MRPLLALALALAPTLVLTACSTSPDRLCDHLVTLAERQFGDLDPNGGTTMRERAMGTCVEEKSALKKHDRKAYDCFADCVMDMRSLAEAADCEPKCGIPPKAHPEEPEPEGIPGLWTDPYADAETDADRDADADDAGEGG